MANEKLHVWFRRLALFASVFALAVVILGAYTRLSDAGLGCPDWPGCYGQLLGVPDDEGHRSEFAKQVYGEDAPQHRLDPGAGWKEMIHRYFAGTLGLLIAVLAVMAFVNRHHVRQPRLLPAVLLGLVVFQALLGMWTVTLQLKPVVVMGHLLGGFATLSLLWWLAVDRRGAVVGVADEDQRFLPWALVGLGVLVVQIALGGWTSSNYAALACPDFPQCQGSWWPSMHIREGFVLWRGLGVDYEFGVLESPARTAIHMMHRIGAVLTATYLGWFAIRLLLAGCGVFARRLGVVVLSLLCMQVGLGISNVIFGLPLPVAVLHNVVAALLLLSMITVVLILARIPRMVPNRSI